jgi:hypothetical protein
MSETVTTGIDTEAGIVLTLEELLRIYLREKRKEIQRWLNCESDNATRALKP